MNAPAQPLIRTPDQRLRVFVSSTIEELAAERAAATAAIRELKLTPVLFELGARPHAPRQLYRAYLEQSHVFVGIYGERYGWIAPGMEISGLEDEYLLAGERPKLLYVMRPAPGREPRLQELLGRIEQNEGACYKTFTSARELATLLADDLAVLLSERFETSGAVRPTPPPAGGSGRRALWLGIAATAALLATALALGVPGLVRRSPAPPAAAVQPAAVRPAAEPASIAVLPFLDLSAEADQEYFSDGLTEELLNLLAQVPALRVISRTSSFQFKGRQEDVRAIGRQLNVAHLLEGSVRKSGRRLRITAQLIDATSGFHRWSRTYDRDLDDVFRVQDEIASEVVKNLEAMLVGGTLPARRPPRSTEAYTLVLRGRYFSDRHTPDDSRRALADLERAVALDPEYAVAWAELARAHVSRAGAGFAPLEKSFALARQAAERSLALDPNLAIGHAMLGYLEGSYDGDWQAADRRYKRALALDSTSSGLLANAGMVARALGRLDESIELYRSGLARDPLQALLHTGLAISLLFAGQLEEAEAMSRQGIALRPGAVSQQYLLGRILLAKGELQAAREAFTEERDEGWRLMGQALASHALGLAGEADAALSALETRFANDMPFQIAEVRAYRGENDRAFAWLDRARELRDPGFVEMKGSPLLRRLHADPRYATLLRAVGLPEG